MDYNDREQLIRKLKRKKLRKGILVCLASIIVISAIWNLSIEDRDAKLEDGTGEVIVNNAGDGEKKELSDLSEEEKANLKPSDIKADTSKDMTASNGGNKVLKPKKPKKVTVTLEIRCDTLSNEMWRLEEKSIKKYIPKDGTILAKTEYKGTTDNTVFDALKTLCRNNEIQLEFSYTPIYEAYYIQGINYLYEFDAGRMSGWMYNVNGWVPNYGCSSYYLSDGDEIIWAYTCEGYGEDLGATWGERTK